MLSGGDGRQPDDGGPAYGSGSRGSRDQLRLVMGGDAAQRDFPLLVRLKKNGKDSLSATG